MEALKPVYLYSEKRIKCFALVGEQFKLNMTQKIKTNKPLLKPLQTKKLVRSTKFLLPKAKSCKIFNDRLEIASSKFQEGLARKLRLRF